MARDRKRAKQRRERGASGGGGRTKALQAPATSQPVRADLPGALEHAGDVDEFDAALVRGAGGVPASAETLSQAEAEAQKDTLTDAEVEAENENEEELAAPDALEAPGGPAGPRRPGGDGGGGGGGGEAERPESGAPLRGGNRAISFLRASWAELQRVQWPDRRQVTQATAVVLGFVAIAGLYLGLADYVAKEIVEYIL